jgi:hypothetical protein
VVGLLFSVAMIAVIVAAQIGIVNARKRVFAEAARALGGTPGASGFWKVGETSVRYTIGAGLTSGRRQTVCTVRLPAEAPPFEMELRPQTWHETYEIERGRAIDLVLGDASFDESFVVEAAPSDVARAVLDERARTGMLAFFPCRLRVEGTALTFTKTALLDEMEEVKRVLELCLHVASRLNAVPSELHEKRFAEAARDGELGGYRGASPDAMRALAQVPAAADEIEALHRVRRGREYARISQVVLMVLAAIALGFLVRHR